MQLTVVAAYSLADRECTHNFLLRSHRPFSPPPPHSQVQAAEDVDECVVGYLVDAASSRRGGAVSACSRARAGHAGGSVLQSRVPAHAQMRPRLMVRAFEIRTMVIEIVLLIRAMGATQCTIAGSRFHLFKVSAASQNGVFSTPKRRRVPARTLKKLATDTQQRLPVHPRSNQTPVTVNAHQPKKGCRCFSSAARWARPCASRRRSASWSSRCAQGSASSCWRRRRRFEKIGAAFSPRSAHSRQPRAKNTHTHTHTRLRRTRSRLPSG